MSMSRNRLNSMMALGLLGVLGLGVEPPSRKRRNSQIEYLPSESDVPLLDGPDRKRAIDLQKIEEAEIRRKAKNARRAVRHFGKPPG